MHQLLKNALDAICRERDNQEYEEAFGAVESLVKEFGQQCLAERVFDQVPRTVPFELVSELFELLAWQTNDNGAVIHRTIEAWLLAGTDNRKLLVALHLGAYPFRDQREMETVLSALAASNARVASRCNELILSRRNNGAPLA